MPDCTYPGPGNSLRCWTTFSNHREDHDPYPVAATLVWTPADPLAVSVEFHNPDSGENPIWYVARDLLAAGFRGRTGCGDVRVHPPVDGWLRVVLDSPNGHADFTVCADTIAEFLEASFDACPPGAEFDDLDVEAELLALIESEAA
jgi:hypothetical protein